MHSDRSDDDRSFRTAAYVGAAVVFGVIMWLRFSDEPEPPRMPRPPAKVAAADVSQLNYSAGIYRASLDRDANEVGARGISQDELTSPFAHESVDLDKALKPGGPAIETSTLRLTARTAELEVDTGRGSFRGEHLILRIENKTDHHLAYRVETVAGQRCLAKGDLPHNALALAPRETIERTECVYRDSVRLGVKHVETIKIPPLSYYYVSRLYPPHIAGDARTTRGHKPARGEVCPDIPEQSIRLGMQRKDVTWRDVIDFYARHSCLTYIFPPGYRAFDSKDQYQLPVSRQAAAQAP